MNERHMGGRGRHSPWSADADHSHHHGRLHRHHRGGEHGGRLFDYGELRLLVLAMIAEQPRHGYEIIKLIEERFGGSYTPSPGVIYPTLSWLEDMGYTTVEATETSRKRYGLTAEGKAFLVANRAAADELMSRVSTASTSGEPPAQIIRAMENFKLAMRLRLKRGSLETAAALSIAAALDAVAQTVEQS
jgi:DNA-binding PadR family transcriptional regulator